MVELSFIVQEPSGIIECTRDTSLFSSFFMYLRGLKSVFIVDFTLKDLIFRIFVETNHHLPMVDKCPNIV